MNTRGTVPLWVMLLVAGLGLVVGTGASLLSSGAPPQEPALTMRLTELPATVDGHAVTAATMSPHGVVALGAENGRVAIVDSRRGTTPLGRHTSSGSQKVADLVFSADGTSLAIVNQDGAVDTLVLRADGAETRTWRPTDNRGPKAVALSANGERVAFTERIQTGARDIDNRIAISVYDTESGAQEAVTGETPEDRGTYYSIGFTRSGRSLVGASEDGVDFWRLPGGEWEELVEPICGELAAAAWTHLVTCGSAGHVLVVDLNRRVITGDQTVSTSAEVTASCVTADGTLVFAATTDGAVTAWHPATDRVVVRTEVADSDITNLMVTKDAKHLFVTTFDGRSWIADLSRGSR